MQYVKWLVGLFAVVIGLAGHPAAAWADSGWQIDSFSSGIEVQTDGLVKVDETILADFQTAKHGIYRDIPTSYQRPDGLVWYTAVTPVSVRRNGANEPYTTERNGDYERLQIGDASRTITGKQKYDIIYTVKGALAGYSGYDELYWNVTGNGWGVPIGWAEATVRLPEAGVVQASCYEGVVGSTEVCEVTPTGVDGRMFGPTRALAAGEGLTVAVGYTKGMVPLATVSAQEAEVAGMGNTAEAGPNLLVSGVSGGVVALVGLLFVWQLWYRKGRDWWWRNPQTLDNNQTAQLKPIGARDTVVVEFTPPEHLPPGMIGLLKDERADTLDVTATIVDLACRGYLTMTEQPKTGLLGSADYLLSRTDKSADGLMPYEQLLLERLFAYGHEIHVSSLRDEFYNDLARVKRQLYEDAISKGYFQKNPNQTRQGYLIAGIVLLAIGLFFGFHLLSGGVSIIGGMLLGLALTGATLAAVSQFMSTRSALGHEMYRRSMGYRLFIATAEQYRQQFFEQQNLFNQILPYAMMFGLIHKFAQAMKQIGYEPPQPGWYSGYSTFNALSFANNLATVSQTLSATMTSAPSSSGSGGGGFSGGGFGGGGGGSW